MTDAPAGSPFVDEELAGANHFLPPLCLSCGDPVLDHLGEEGLCSVCRRCQVARRLPTFCSCGVPTADHVPRPAEGYVGRLACWISFTPDGWAVFTPAVRPPREVPLR